MTGRRIARSIVLAVAVAAPVGCGGSSFSYSAANKAAFLKGCEAQGNPATCTCMLSYFEAHTPPSKLLAATAAAKATGTVPQLFRTAANSCVGGRTTTT